MRRRMLRALIISAFAIALGHLAWHALFKPPVNPEYLVGGQVPALCGPNPDDRHLYVRRELYLSQRPRRAWLQVLARDRVRLFVNGKFVAQQTLAGHAVAILADLAPYLQTGRNILAIIAEQGSIGKPPIIAVDGAYAFE